MRNFLGSAAIAAIPLTTLCVFASLSIYAGNHSEFSASWFDLLRVYLPWFLIVAGLFGLLGTVMTENGRSRYWSVLSALGVLFWLQGNILVWDYGVLDGREINWLDGLWRGVLDLTLWTAILLVALSAHRRVGKTLILAAVATFGIQVVGAAATVISNFDNLQANVELEANETGREAMYRFSRTRNVVHIVMDGFQTDIFAGIVNDPDNSEIRRDLAGFTVFSDNLGVFPYTQLTVPAILSGELYSNQVPVADFIQDTMTGPTILNAVREAGYEVDIAAPVGLKNVYSKADHDHAVGITRAEHVAAQDYIDNDSAKLMDLALFRVVPHFAKALVHRDELWVFQSGLRSAAYLQIQYFSDLAFLQRLAERMSADREVPVYKMMHVMISHRPTVANEECGFDGTRTTNRENVTIQSRCGLLKVLAVLNRMKELRIYEDSLIVLMADHGAWVPVDGLSGGGVGDTTVSAMTVAMAIPVLAIKPPGQSKPLRFSDAQTSVADVPATIAELLDLNAQFRGAAAFSIDPGATRQRRHLTYGYGINPDAEGYLFPMQEFKVNGSPFDALSWTPGNRFLPEGIVSAQ